jgi:hypothetical protein
MRLKLRGVWPDLADEAAVLSVAPDGNNARGWVGWKPFANMKMWVQGVECMCVGPYTYELDLNCLGFIGEKGKRREITAGSDIVSAENIKDPDGGPWKKHQASVRSVGIEIMYVQEAVPDTTAVGRPLDPELPPGVSANPWINLEEPTKHYPHGWILEARPYEQLVNATAFLVRDRFRFQDDVTP